MLDQAAFQLLRLQFSDLSRFNQAIYKIDLATLITKSFNPAACSEATAKASISASAEGPAAPIISTPATISRVKRCLVYGADGYNSIMPLLKKEDKHNAE